MNNKSKYEKLLEKYKKLRREHNVIKLQLLYSKHDYNKIKYKNIILKTKMHSRLFIKK
jgi:hypothetical protein